MKLRKIQLANEDIYKVALRQPKIKDPSRKKNIETNALGETRIRVHMAKQNLNTMALKPYKVNCFYFFINLLFILENSWKKEENRN